MFTSLTDSCIEGIDVTPHSPFYSTNTAVSVVLFYRHFLTKRIQVQNKFINRKQMGVSGKRIPVHVRTLLIRRGLA